jgi:hypothetical protein
MHEEKKTPVLTGGCLCGALRYEARGEPSASGYCYCQDCRKASGSGFIPFMVFEAAAVSVRGEVLTFPLPLARGGEAVRNACPRCAGLVFGGRLGQDASFTVYAGSLDDPARFHPALAIFVGERAPWAPLPETLKAFEGMPG